jgi:hypothetical protein
MENTLGDEGSGLIFIRTPFHDIKGDALLEPGDDSQHHNVFAEEC